MFDDGLIDEAKKLRNLSLSRTAYQAIGYKESFDFIDGNRDNHSIDNIRLLCPNCYYSFNGQFPSSGKF